MSYPEPVSEPLPKCPQCQVELTLGGGDSAPYWSCPNGHGLACTMTAAYGRIDDAQIQGIWHASENAPEGSRACPMCGKAMVEVPASAGSALKVDVCRDDEVFWLDSGEVDKLPEETPDAPPSAEEEANLQKIRDEFDTGIDKAIRDANTDVVDRIIRRFKHH
jgi:Zn-finger nucleic acid-binding protein